MTCEYAVCGTFRPFLTALFLSCSQLTLIKCLLRGWDWALLAHMLMPYCIRLCFVLSYTLVFGTEYSVFVHNAVSFRQTIKAEPCSWCGFVTLNYIRFVYIDDNISFSQYLCCIFLFKWSASSWLIWYCNPVISRFIISIPCFQLNNS